MPPPDRSRAVSSVLAVVLLVTIVVLLAGTVGAFALSTDLLEPAPRTAFDADADASADRITVTHRGGDPVDPDRLRVRILVEGAPIVHQPPVPFFAATGFVSGPTGPFNSAATGDWTTGETASLRLASTNTDVDAGDRVTIQLFAGDLQLAELVVAAT